jgi:biotin carboxyl carrier protein
VTLFALLLVLFPFLFWYNTWFGRRLTDAELDRYLHDELKPRHTQHALVQIGERLTRGDASVARWYPRVIELSGSPRLEFRQTAAWIMGQDHRYQPFQQALRTLLQDPEPTVRRNAALALSNFRDLAALPELHAMLRQYRVVAPAAGRLKFRLKPGEYVNPETLVAHVGAAEVRAPLPGTVRALLHLDGAAVQPGDGLLELSPDEKHVWEALRALLLIGGRQETEDVERFAKGVPGMTGRVRDQATQTLEAIRGR